MPEENTVDPASETKELPAVEVHNPFDFARDAASFEPALAAIAKELPARLKNVDPQEAARIVQAIHQATAQKRQANEILETVFGLLGKGIGLVL